MRIPQHFVHLARAHIVDHVRVVAHDFLDAFLIFLGRFLDAGADQFQPGTRLDRWLFAILRSIWLNESRARRVRAGQGVLDAGEALSVDGAHEIETNISAAQVLRAIGALPSAQRETVLLVYVEGYSYREAAELLGAPIGTVMSRLAAARATLIRTHETKDA